MNMLRRLQRQIPTTAFMIYLMHVAIYIEAEILRLLSLVLSIPMRLSFPA